MRGQFPPHIAESPRTGMDFTMPIPQQLAIVKCVSLTTFKKDGSAVRTPVWFAEDAGKLYFKTRNDSWKYKRIRNNPRVSVAPCTMRGTVTGPEFAGRARILPTNEWDAPRKAIRAKYWLTRLPFWSRRNEFIEVELETGL